MGAAARSSSSTLWRSLLSRLHGQQNPFPSSTSSSSYGPILKGCRYMSSAPSPKLFIGGLSWSTDENALREAFADFGEIAEVKIILDRETGRSRGFGFVTYMSTDDAETAQKEMNNTNIGGRSIRVDFAVEKPRSFGGGGGGGFGGSGGFGGGGFGGGQSGGDSSFGGSSFSSPSNTSFGSSDGSSSYGGNDGSGGGSFSNDSFGNDSFGKDSFGSKSKDDFGSKSFDNDSFSFDDSSFGDNKDKY